METSKHKNRQVAIVKEPEAKPAFELSPFNESKFNTWKEKHYHKNEVGYYTDVVPNFRVYYAEEDVLTEYTKQKRWCEDPEDKEVYKKFRFGFEYDLFF
jgi:hypothetical protein